MTGLRLVFQFVVALEKNRGGEIIKTNIKIHNYTLSFLYTLIFSKASCDTVLKRNEL